MKDDDDLIRAYWFGFYDASREWRDAAEFEARVAVKLLNMSFPIYCDSSCPWSKRNRKGSRSCINEFKRGDCILRSARLTVEEEMDGR